MIHYIVTGGNRGIGKEISRVLANRFKDKTICITCRVEKDGSDTVKELGLNNIIYHTLDITSIDSINKFSEYVKKMGGFEVLINNAGYASRSKELNYDMAKYTIDVNYYGTVNLTKALLPYIKPEGRIINVSSSVGLLNNDYSDELKKRFLDENITEEDINKIAEEFLEGVKNNNCKDLGFPENSYRVSKCLLNSWTRMLGRDHGDKIFIAAVNPGWVRTRMGGPNATLSVEEGAVTPVYLATEPFETLIKNNGKYWSNKTVGEY